MIDADTLKGFFKDWKDEIAIGISVTALLISAWGALRDHYRLRLQRPQFKFFVWIATYKDMEALERFITASLPTEQRERAMIEWEWFNWAIHVRAINEGLQPVTIEYCFCDITSAGVNLPAPQRPPHVSKVATVEDKCKLGTGEMHEWIIKLRAFPYRMSRIYICNSVGFVAQVGADAVLDLHRKNVWKWPYTDGRLSLLPRPVSLLFLRWYRWRFRPTEALKSVVPADAEDLMRPGGRSGQGGVAL